MAEGNETAPIIFCRGDWGCILGDAPLIKLAVSLFDFNLNQKLAIMVVQMKIIQILKFVIEYSGRKLKEQKNLMVCRLLVWGNENIQISFSNDSF
jgi:hypothetical protein